MIMRAFLVFAFILLLSFPAAAFAAENLPPGFIALSESDLTWEQAKAWCQQRGGRLPLIGASNSLGSVPTGTSIDGFGTVGAPWPPGLPGGLCWAGTVDSDYSDYSWLVNAGGGVVDVYVSHQSSNLRAACVPYCNCFKHGMFARMDSIIPTSSSVSSFHKHFILFEFGVFFRFFSQYQWPKVLIECWGAF